jgi:hypothetical protein
MGKKDEPTKDFKKAVKAVDKPSKKEKKKLDKITKRMPKMKKSRPQNQVAKILQMGVYLRPAPNVFIERRLGAWPVQGRRAQAASASAPSQRVTIEGPEVDRLACPATQAEDIEPRRPGEQRGPDRR